MLKHNQPHNTSDKEDQAYFGHRVVSPQEKTHLVGDVFRKVAERYDIMNDAMSFGLHRLWKAALIADINPQPNQLHLDVAGGSGDISFSLLKKMNLEGQVLTCDINHAMLQVGQKRAWDKGIWRGIEFICGNAESLPFPDQSMDVYVISFGLRNVTNIPQALAEAYRVLKPGGRFFCLEFSPKLLPGFDRIYRLYAKYIIPQLGQLLAGDADPYHYLVESIERFYAPDDLLKLLQQVGFDQVRYYTMTAGVVAIHSGWKC